MAIEKLANFILDVAYPRINEELQRVEQESRNQETKLKEKYLSCLKEIFTNVQRTGKQLNMEVAYLSFTLLRSNILYGKNTYDVHIYDKEWYANDYIKVGEIDVSFFFGRLEEIKKYLLRESRKYVGGINASDLDNIISQSIEPISRFFIRAIKNVIAEAIECDEYKSIVKSDDFKIYTGELYGEPIVLHIETKAVEL